MSELDQLIHQPVRLRIMAVLTALEKDDKVDFVHLREILGVTDGNLGSHLQKLDENNYINMQKKFVSKKPKSLLSVTSKGRAAYEAHIKALHEIIGI